jgi:hypothetical protein
MDTLPVVPGLVAPSHATSSMGARTNLSFIVVNSSKVYFADRNLIA